MFATTEPMDLAADFPDLISAANKVFGEGKWNHTVVSQTLDFEDANYDALNDPRVYHTGCVSFVKVQLENGNFHEDVGYFKAEEFTQGLSIYNARIGSAVNALRRVLLSFGEKIDKELQRQVIPKQVSDIKRNATQSLEPMDLIAELPDLISAANKVFGEGNWRHTVVKQILGKKYTVRGAEYHADCVSYVKVQLKNENFHVDVGYCS
ncbi:Dna repair protein rad52-like protein, partial [Temnothorax longispinosus]